MSATARSIAPVSTGSEDSRSTAARPEIGRAVGFATALLTGSPSSVTTASIDGASAISAGQEDALADSLTRQSTLQLEAMYARRVTGACGSSGTYAPPDLSIPYTATTAS